jgi:hypothetical protein
MTRPMLLLLFSLSACQRTGVVLTIHGTDLATNELRLTAALDGRTLTRSLPEAPSTAPLLLPSDLFAEFEPRAATVVFTVDALDSGRPLASAVLPPLRIEPYTILAADVYLTSSGSPPAAPPAKVDDPAPMGPPKPSYPSVVLADAPIAYYRLDETTGTVATDSSGHGLHGTWGANVTRGVPGLLASGGRAATFNGGTWSPDGIITVPRNGALEPGRTFSVELWLRQPVFNPDFAVLAAYGNAPSAPQDPPYGALLYQKALAVFMWTDIETAGSPDFISTTQPAINQTYHFVETYDTQSARIYVNGVLESQRPLSGTLLYPNGRSGLGIGGIPDGSSADVIFAGTLDEVAIYGVALSPQQVKAHFEAGKNP